MVLITTDSLKYAYNKITTLNLEVVLIIYTSIKAGEKRSIISKILRISRSIDILILILPF